MKIVQRGLFFALLTGGVAWVVFLSMQGATPALPETLAPLFQMAGKVPRAFDATLTRTLPLDDLDEKAYGDAIYKRYAAYSQTQAPEQKYLEALVAIASTGAAKPFPYRVLYSPQEAPNAFAMPGGVIIVTAGLLKTLQSENEILAVLGHEVGHVEAGHCLNAVRFEIAARKVGAKKIGELADLAVMILTRHAYSKTDEAQADDYGYEVLAASRYSPAGAGHAFEHLLASQKKYAMSPGQKNAVSEYFQTHPYLEHRIERFSEKARIWKLSHPGEKRYVGRANLKSLKTMSQDMRNDEWDAP